MQGRYKKSFTEWLCTERGEKAVYSFYAVFFAVKPEGNYNPLIKNAFEKTVLKKKGIYFLLGELGNIKRPEDRVAFSAAEYPESFLHMLISWFYAEEFLEYIKAPRLIFRKLNKDYIDAFHKGVTGLDPNDPMESFGFDPQYLPEWHPYKILLRQSKPFMDKEAVFGQL